MNWLAIDPGLSGTGWASFRDKNLIRWGIISQKGKNFEERSQHILDGFYGEAYELWKNCNGPIFIEWPSFQTMEAQNTGSIIKLAFLIGRLYDRFHWVLSDPKLIPVIKWKGQLPKAVTQARAEVFFGMKGFKSHAADAVAIGQYVIEAGLI